MKFDSKTLLEEIIRTHLFEQTNISDTNVARPGLGTLYIYGNIEDPPDVSQADATFFKKINQTLPKTNKLTKRPFIKIFTKSKGGGVDENSRITNAVLTVLGRASNLINSYSADITNPKLADFSMIVSQPQIAKPLKKATDSEIATEYNPEDKLYYTFVLIKNTDINTSITPSYTVSGTKVYAESQISSLKPIVKTSADDAIDNKFITTIAQLNNIGTSGLEKIRNLQRLLYTWTEKVNPQLKTAETIKDSYSNFVKSSWNTAESPNNWDGKKGDATDTYIKYLQIGFQKQGTEEQPTVDVLIKILSDEVIAKDEVTANTLSLNESKSLKILTEQEEEWVFNYDNIKDLKPINTDDDNTKTKTKTKTNTNTVKTKTSVSGTGILASKDFTVPEWWKKLAKLSRFCDQPEYVGLFYIVSKSEIIFLDENNVGNPTSKYYHNFKVSTYLDHSADPNTSNIYDSYYTYKQLINDVTDGQNLGIKNPTSKINNANNAVIDNNNSKQASGLVYRVANTTSWEQYFQTQQITLTYYNGTDYQKRTFKISGDNETEANNWLEALENHLGSQGIGDPENTSDDAAKTWKNKNQALKFFNIYKAAVNGIQQVFNKTAGKYTKYISAWGDNEELAWREVGQPALRKYIEPRIQELRSIMKNTGVSDLEGLAGLDLKDICNDNWVGDMWSAEYASLYSDVLGAAGIKNYGSRADDDTGWIVCMAENYVMLVQAIWQPKTGWEDLDWYWSYTENDDTRTLWRAWSTSDNSWEFIFWKADGATESVSIDTDFDDDFRMSSQNSKQSSYDGVKVSDRE